MKQLRLFKTMLLMCLLLSGISNAWGEVKTATKTMGQVVSENNYTVSSGSTINTKCFSIDLDANINVSVSTREGATGNTGTFWGTTTIDWRMYQADAPAITISAKNDYTISKVKITYSKSNTGVINTVGCVTSVNNSNSQISSGTYYDVNNTSVTYYVGNSASATNGQARITEIEVEYSDAESTLTKYNVNVAANITGGNVAADKESASQGETVTLTATPTTGYEFGSWSVINASTDNAIEVTENGSFTMPASNVNVSAVFAEIFPENTQSVTFGPSEEDDYTWPEKTDEQSNNLPSLDNIIAGDVKLVFSNGGTNFYSYFDGEIVRFYQSNTMTVTPLNGKAILKVVITRQNKSTSNAGDISATIDGEPQDIEGTHTTPNIWRGSTTRPIVFKAEAQARFTKVEVWYAEVTPEIEPSSAAVTLDFTSNDSWNIPTAKTVESGSFSDGTYSITLEGSEGNGYRYNSNVTYGNYLILGKNGASLTLPAFDFDVERIVVYGNSEASQNVIQNIFVGENAISTATTGANVTNTYNISQEYQSAGNIYILKVLSDHNTQISKIEIYAKESEGPDTPTDPEIPDVTLTTIDEIFAKAQEVNGTATDVKVTFNNWVISGLNGTKNAYLTDNQGKGLIIFDNNASHGFEVGDVLSGTVACKVQMYNGSAELTALSSASDGLSIAKSGNVVEQNINISSLEGINTGALLSYEGLTYHLNGTNAEFTDGENVITAYKGIIGTLPELVEGKTYNVKGIFLMYGTKKEILPRTVEDIVLVEVINNYIVTYGTTENGTIVVKNGETVINSGDEVSEGTKLTIECTPANDDYRFKSWEYKEDGGEWITNATSFDFTMPSANVQFRATFELIPVYTITWSENGNVTTQSYKEGAKLVPPTVEEIYGKVFTGWVTSESVDASTEPYYVKPSNATAPATYYAVYATKRGEDVLREFTFTIGTNNFKGGGYAVNNGSHTIEATANDGTTMSVYYTSEDVMLGSSTIQFRGNTGYLYNTTDLGSIKSITLADRSVNLAVYYGDTEHPTEGTEATGGYFTVSSNTNNVGSSNSITVVFEKATGATYSHFTTRVRTLDISETDKPIQGEGYYDGVKVARTINANRWSVLCLPFDMSADQIAASFHDVNVEVRRMTGLRIVGNTYKIIFSPVTSMKKGIPYIISLSGKKEGFIANDVIVDCAGDLVDRVNAGDEEVIFHGTYEDTFSPIGEEYKIFVNNELRTVINQIRVKCTGGYFEMPSTPEDFAITLADVPTYTINWKVNGKYEAPVTLIEGSDLEAPSVADIYGKVWTGWVTTPTVDADIEPDYVDFETTKATDKFTFYAVFATMSGESTEIAQELTEEEIVGLGQLAYATEKTYKDNDIDYTIHAYKDQASRKWLQLKKDQGSYVNIKAPSAIKKVSLIITSASNSSGGVNDITKHTAFDGTVALTTSDCTYSATSQSVASTNSISDNVATLVPTGDNNELYLKVSSGARIWGITVTYGENVSYSKFTTLVKVLLLDENVEAIPEEMEICDPFDAVIINRSIKKDTWSTLCLPFAMNESQIVETFGKKADVRELSGLVVNGNSYTMKFSPVTSITEGTPYMIRLEEPVNSILVKDVDVYYYDDDYCVDAWSEDNNNCVAYHGSYIKQTIEQSPNNYIISSNKFYFVNSDVTNKGFRGWFEILSDDASAASLSASFDDETNGITSISVGDNADDNYYNVAGQRVSNAHKGVFIKNGKKYVVK